MNLSRMAAIAASVALALAGTSRANDIKGKVSVQGIKTAENIAVYVDVIADKKVRRCQKITSSLTSAKWHFLPHVVAVQQGTTVELLEQRSRRPQRLLALDQREQETLSQSRHLAERRQETIPVQ